MTKILTSLSFALLLCSCVSSSGSEISAESSNLRGLDDTVVEREETPLGQDVITTWDFDYNMIQWDDDYETIDITRFWRNVYVTIGNQRFSAIISSYGLYLSPIFIYKIPHVGSAKVGPNTFQYNVEYDTEKPDELVPCSKVAETPLALEGSKIIAYIFYIHDTWVKSGYVCPTDAGPVSSRVHCHPRELYEDDFTCTDAISNMTDNSLIPIWQEAGCKFLPQCALDYNFIMLADAKAVEDCYQGTFQINKKCVKSPVPLN